MKVYLLPEDVRNALLAYLVQRPYGEVHKGIDMLEGLKEAPPVLAVVPPAEEKKGD